MDLWYYQTDLVRRTANATRAYRKIVIQSSTGSGKTMMFSHIAHSYISNPKNAGKSVLILVHRIELHKQTRKTLYKNFGIHTQPIVRGMKMVPYGRVYVAMVDSSVKHIPNIPNIGLVIEDEAHRAEIYKKNVLFLTQIILAFTATPISATKKDPLKNHYEAIVCGPQIKELIAFNKDHPGMGLCQNITYCPEEIVNRGDLSMTGGDFDVGMMGLEFSKPQYVDNVVKVYKEKADGTKSIIFNATVAHSKKVMAAFLAAGYECKHIDSDNCTDRERENIMNWFEHTRGAILCNVGIATTGLDVPTIETVIINLSTTSLSKWLQMCGRGSRPCIQIGKQLFYIIDMGGNAVLLGDWSADRDWEDIFNNPPKPSDKLQPAPVKICPQCSALVPAQSRTCDYCGFVFPVKPREEEGEIGKFMVFTQGINVEKVISEHKHRKKYFSFYEIGKQLARGAKDTMPAMTNEAADFIYNTYIEKAKEWAALHNHKGVGDFLRTEARVSLFKELSKHFKGWEYQSSIVTVIE